MTAKTLFLFLLSALHYSAASATTDHLAVQRYSSGGITRTEFRQTLATAHRLFSPLAARDGRKLEFLTDWNQDWAQAFARRWDNDQVVIYGGIARIPRGTIDTFALFICHELGHLYGGTPYRDEHNRIAVEGQADWWATSECWNTLAADLPARPGSLEQRGVEAALIVTAFYAANRNIPAPAVETPDSTRVEKTLMTHPEPQCRLDTYIAGLLKNERPRCWWAPQTQY